MSLSNKWTALFLSNFLGVFNDNFLKNCIIFISIGWALPSWLSQAQLIAVVSACLVIPYLFLSPFAGRLAVTCSKIKVFSLGKLIEIPVLIIASVSFLLHFIVLAIVCVLLMGVISCLYSPAKYSLIRDIGGEKGVSFGSGVFEMMAFLGILFGTVLASVASDHFNQWFIIGIMIGVAVTGYFATQCIKAKELPVETGNATINPIKYIVNSYRLARNYTHVNSAVFGASVFWLIGGVLQMNLVVHSKNVYHTTNMQTGMVMMCAAIGVALGTWFAGKLSGKTVKKQFVIPAVGLMGLFFIIISFASLPFVVFLALIFLIALAGGFFQIPCLAIIQNANLGRKLGDVIGYLNLVTFIFVLVGTAIFSLISSLTHENSFSVFLCLAFICVGVGVFYLSDKQFR